MASFVLTAFCVPAAVGEGGPKGAAWALSKVKVNTKSSPYHGLAQGYHDRWHGRSDELVDLLFQDDNKDAKLTLLAGEDMFDPGDCYSGVANYDIIDDFWLLARVNGVSRDRKTIVCVDTYKDRYTNRVWPDGKLKCLASMLPWKAERCIYHYAKTRDTHVVTWDAAEWDRILPRLQAFAEDAKARLAPKGFPAVTSDDGCVVCLDALSGVHTSRQCGRCRKCVCAKCLKKLESVGDVRCPHCRSPDWASGETCVAQTVSA